MHKTLQISLAVSVAFVPVLVHARPENRAEARRLFERGKRHFRSKRYRRAIEAFKHALVNRRHRVLHYNIALAYARLGNVLSAAMHLTRYLRQATADDPPLPLELRRILERVAVLKIRTKNMHARIYIDGQPAGRGQVERVVRPGVRTVEIRLNGKTLAKHKMVVAAGGKEEWNWTLPAKSKTPGEKPGSRRTRLHWVYFAAGAALTTALCVAAASTSAKTDQLHRAFAADRTDASLRARGIRYERAAKALWGITAVSAAATAAIAVFTRWRSKETQTRFQAAVLPAPAGISVSVLFRR